MEQKHTTKRKYMDVDPDYGLVDKKPKINNNDVDNLTYALRKATITDNQVLVDKIHQLSETVNQLITAVDTIKTNEIILIKQIEKLKDKNSRHESTISVLSRKHTELELEIINLKEDIRITSANNCLNSTTSVTDWNSYIT